MTVESIFRDGVVAHQAGQLDLAESLYREVLARDAGHADATHYLGLIAFQRGCFSLAVDQIAGAIVLSERAGRLAPAEYHVNLGNALKRAGRPDEALAAYRTALQRRPDLAAAAFNLALLQRAAGDLQGAIASLAVVCRGPSSSLFPTAWVELAECHAGSGDERAALQCFDHVIPRLVARNPSAASTDLLARVAKVLVGLGRPQPAIELLEPLCTARPGDAELLNVLGCAQSSLGHLGDAERSLTRALVQSPRDVAATDNLACVYKDTGRIDAALGLFRELLSRRLNVAGVWSNYLFTLLYSDRIGPPDILAEHRRAAAALAPPEFGPPLPTAAKTAPGRRLRLAYLSGDFRNHPVAYFMAGILSNHDLATVDVLVYDNSGAGDKWTERLKAFAPNWRAVRCLPDRQLAELIRQDGIDVLIELSGHTADNRLAALAWHPATVQASYLGYPFSTGLPWIDWRIVDTITDPPGAEAYASERLYHLPRSYYAYTPPDDAPEPGELPMRRNGYLTFGVSSNLAKVSPTTLDVWASLLHSFADARLRWRARAFADPEVRRAMTDALRRRGIATKRVRLDAWAAHGDRWQAFRDIDVALDTYPYNQATNTCEALWMGVPTLSVAGTVHSSRMGASILTDAGLAEWVFSVDRILQAPGVRPPGMTELLRPELLSELRRTLRSRLRNCRLLDTADAAREIEAACRRMLAGC